MITKRGEKMDKNQKIKIRSKKRTENKKLTLVYCLLFICTVVVVVPFFVIIITSFKSNAESSNPVFTWWPKNGFHFDGYKKILFSDVSGGINTGSSILRGLINTLWINLIPTVVGLFVASLSAYTLAKVKFKGANFIFSTLLLTIMIPSIITLTPSYLLYDMIGWTRTPLPLIVPGLFGGSACVFFMRQYYKGMPDELIDSAKIDGLGNFGVFVKIMLPLSKPALISQFMIIFIGRYNDYTGPLLYLTGTDLYTLQIALRANMGTYVNDWQTVMAGCVVSIVPLLIIYFFLQNYFINGIAINSGIKR